ncbi:MAG: response regulator transcription factor [Chitinophagales bacterium]
MTIRVAIVEDNLHMRSALQKVVSSSDALCCTATFEDAESFSAKFMDMNVDVVLIGINLPGNSGIHTVARLKPRKPEVQFLMCTIIDDSPTIFDSLSAGATGYLLKDETPSDIIKAIISVKNGGSPMSPQVSRQVVESFQGRKTNAAIMDLLTSREWEILKLLDKGFRYKEVSDILCLSFETIRTYVRDIYEKLEVHSRTDALNKVFQKNGEDYFPG